MAAKAVPRACPHCGQDFLITGLHREIVDLSPEAPILPYEGGAALYPVGQCPHCEEAITSDAFPAAGQCIPANVPLLEATCREVAEGAPLVLPSSLSTKLSQDDPEGWIRADSRSRGQQMAREALADKGTPEAARPYYLAMLAGEHDG